jgi:sigma-B regulation protein RsbU (phosphoserine phosphatase)
VTLIYVTSVFYLTLGIILILLGFIILKENVRQRVNRITGAMMFFAGMGSIFAAFGLLIRASLISDANLASFRRLFLAWEFFFPQMLLFALVFPRENEWARRHRYIYWLIYIPHLVHFLLILGFSSPDQVRNLVDLQALSDRFGLIIQPVTIILSLILSLISLIYEFHTNFFALINLIYIITAIGLMVWGYRKLKNPRLKKQVGLVLWGIRASVGLYAIAFIFPHLNILETTVTMAHLLTSVALLIGALSIAWAIIRYQFLDIRLIIRRGLIYSLASSVLIGIYLLIYGQGKKWITGVLGIEIPILEILFIILALLFFQPILNAIERILERIFMRDRLDYRNVLQDLSHDIMTTLDPTVLQHKITITLKQAMSLEQVCLLVAGSNANYTYEEGDQKLVFHYRDPWIQFLVEHPEPVGFDELSIQIEDSASLDSLRTLNAYLIIPLIHRDILSGILIMGEKITRTGFTTEDMTILNVLSNQAAIALENARLTQEMLEKQRIQEELDLAREIQINLLPKKYPTNAAFELMGYNLPSKEVGGDYYDFIDLPDNRIGIAIGDIAGKGIPAALLMANLQAALRISAVRGESTCEVMQQVNVHISQTTAPEKFATFFYSVLDPVRLSMEYTNGGHNFPILCRRDGSYQFLKEGGIIVGVMEGALYQSARVQLQPGDLLIMYTDGITEALNPHEELYGEQRLLESIQSCCRQPAQIVMEKILDNVVGFTKGHLQSDDLTLVILKVNASFE